MYALQREFELFQLSLELIVLESFPISDCLLEEFHGGCYLIGDVPLNYDMGLDFCRSHGANLLTLNSAEENTRAFWYLSKSISMTS